MGFDYSAYFSIPTDQLLLTFLAYSKSLREFCGFIKVPDASKITRFKQDFLDDLQLVSDNLVDVTEPICQAIDSAKADMTIFDSSGIEAFVTENNPKYANRIIKQLKAYAKAQGFDKSYDPYKAAYGSMPSHASANPEIKQLYINGHFCYVFKFGIVTNGLGIIRHISFYNKNFMVSHPDIVVERDINHIKDNLCLAGRRTQNEKTLHADLILAGITQLITVVLADKINHHEYIRSLKPLIA